MKKGKPDTNLIIFNGSFLECESLIELRTGATEEEWFGVCKGTIEMYCYMQVGKQLGPQKIGKKDARIIRRLRETIETLKTLDTTNLGMINIDELSQEHVKVIEQEWKGIQKTMKIAHDQAIGNADFYVSGL